MQQSFLDRFLPRQQFDSYEDFVSNYKVNVPENFNFGFDIIDEWAKLDDKKRALVWCDDHGGEKIITYRELSLLSNKAANYFMSIGIKKGDVVMTILRRRWEYWVCAIALHKIGAVIIPGSLQLTKKDIVYRAAAADIQNVICLDNDFVIKQLNESRAEAPSIKNYVLVNGKSEGFLNFDEFHNCSGQFPRPTADAACNNDDVMLIYFTSGTTGMPKMVAHNFTHPLGHIVTAKYWQRVREDKLHMSVTESGWAKFGWGKIYGQMICGACVFAYDMESFIPANLLRVLEKYKVTTFCAPPTMFRFMLQEDVTKYDLSSIQHCGVAGEPLNPEVYKKWKELTGLRLHEGFGQSEGSVLVANFEWFDVKPGCMGKPSPLYNIELINAQGQRCEDGEEGEIVVMGAAQNRPLGLFTAYYKDDEMTRNNLHGEYYGTGDVAWRDSDGYYWFIGRNDDVIKCSGYRIGPFEVESALLEHPAVVECAVTAVPDPIRGQVVKATVVLAKGYQGNDALVRELQEHVKKVTAPYKYPRMIEFVSELPKTIGGKIKRAEIRQKDLNK